ncbi:hypothetical protein [Flavobacterium sp. N1736]|uniref:hypothetical protein n=1 Tax=Flavobacterium sp. N1736 TaxID=2986823 RepID=UPI0022256BD8|nr:hypothetical protein [Flavobacterium sp. N1736]
MKTKNIEGLTMFEINQLIQQGGRFITFPILRKKFKNTPIVYFIRPEESSFKYSLNYFFLNLVSGWRAFPWGPIYALKSLYYIIKGGKDFTETILDDLHQNNPEYNPNLHYLQICLDYNKDVKFRF